MYSLIYLVFVRINLTIYLTWIYSKIPQKLVYETPSVMLLVLMIVSWVSVLMGLLTHSDIVIKNKFGKNKLPSNSISIAHKLCSRIVGLYFVTKFGMFSSGSCDIYSGITSVCFALKVICWINYVWWYLFLICLVIFLLSAYIPKQIGKTIDKLMKITSYALSAF